MMTLVQVASTLNVSESDARGLMDFLRAKKAVKVDTLETGKRGRKPLLFTFTSKTVSTLAEAVNNLPVDVFLSAAEAALALDGAVEDDGVPVAISVDEIADAADVAQAAAEVTETV